MIDKTSRYAATPTCTAKDASGESLELLEIRSIPRIAEVFVHTPTEGERLDLLAERYYRDPRRFWKLCDSSDVMDPLDVLLPGQPIRVPPER